MLCFCSKPLTPLRISELFYFGLRLSSAFLKQDYNALILSQMIRMLEFTRLCVTLRCLQGGTYDTNTPVVPVVQLGSAKSFLGWSLISGF